MLLSLWALSPIAYAATVEKWFEVTWSEAAPDGFPRQVMGVNNTWPPPEIIVDQGDRLVVHCKNALPDRVTSIHFHGLFQNGTNAMDGPAGVTQCGIAPGQTYTYNFTLEQSGVYWWHSHEMGQYPDGLRAPLIVRDPEGPYAKEFDEELTLSLSDWYHDLPSTLTAQFITFANPTGAEPVPQAALLNDTQNATIPVVAGRTYKINFVNVGAFAGQYVWIPGVNMTIVEVDGVYTEKAEASLIYITAAQRYAVLATFQAGANYPIVGAMDQDMFDQIPSDLSPNVTSWFVTDTAMSNPIPDLRDNYDDDFDDFALQPMDGMKLLGMADNAITLDVSMDNLDTGANFAFFNNISYVRQKVPTIFSVMSTGENATDPAVYGEYSNPFVLKHNEVVEIVLNNLDPGKHPFHLHGHNFQVVARSEEDAGTFKAGDPVPDAPKVPMRRDTVLVRPNGYIVLRYVADNPGVFLFHCHIEWHMSQGLIATFIEAPLEMQKMQTIPQQSFDNCAAQSIKTSGNAVGNTGPNIMDLTGQNAPPNSLPAGFTTKGIVAMTFCVVSAMLGCASIALYGAMEIKEGKKAQ